MRYGRAQQTLAVRAKDEQNSGCGNKKSNQDFNHDCSVAGGEEPRQGIAVDLGLASCHWLNRGGLMLPMHQSEAVWLGFKTTHIKNQGSYPFAIKIGTGKINAVTGTLWDDRLNCKPQDYVVAPTKPISPRQYRKAGLPWFKYYKDKARVLDVSAKLASMETVADHAQTVGDPPLEDNESVTVDQTIELRRRHEGQVRDSKW